MMMFQPRPPARKVLELTNLAHALEQREARHLETVDGLDARRHAPRPRRRRLDESALAHCGSIDSVPPLLDRQTIDDGDDHIRSTQTARVCAFLPSSSILANMPGARYG